MLLLTVAARSSLSAAICPTDWLICGQAAPRQHDSRVGVSIDHQRQARRFVDHRNHRHRAPSVLSLEVQARMGAGSPQGDACSGSHLRRDILRHRLRVLRNHRGAGLDHLGGVVCSLLQVGSHLHGGHAAASSTTTCHTSDHAKGKTYIDLLEDKLWQKKPHPARNTLAELHRARMDA